jgi:hypothetical protein
MKHRNVIFFSLISLISVVLTACTATESKCMSVFAYPSCTAAANTIHVLQK